MQRFGQKSSFILPTPPSHQPALKISLEGSDGYSPWLVGRCDCCASAAEKLPFWEAAPSACPWKLVEAVACWDVAWKPVGGPCRLPWKLEEAEVSLGGASWDHTEEAINASLSFFSNLQMKTRGVGMEGWGGRGV